MKFAQLPLNARFTFRSRTFRKVSPLEAIDEAGETRKLIPRSAQVTDVTVDTPSRIPAAPEQLARTEVEAALSACLTRLRDKARTLHPPLDAQQLAAVDTLLQSAGDDVAVRLGLEHHPPALEATALVLGLGDPAGRR